MKLNIYLDVDSGHLLACWAHESLCTFQCGFLHVGIRLPLLIRLPSQIYIYCGYLDPFDLIISRCYFQIHQT